jgi:glycosyltransferase involved in cell wall biosynthesis
MSKPFHIVLFARSLEIGGAEVQITALARGLSNRPDFRVTVVCLYPRGPLLDELKKADVSVVSLEKRGRWDLIGFVPRMIMELRRLAPDVLLSFLAPPNILSSLARPFLGQSIVILGIRASNMDLSNYDWTWRLTHWAERLLSPLAQGIVANSDSGKSYSIDQGFKGDIRVIANGIDIERFRPLDQARGLLRQEFRLGNGSPVIGLVARLDPMKDHRTFINAAAIASASVPDLKFVCVGGGKSEFVHELKNIAADAGVQDKIIWAGPRRDMPDVFSMFDIVTLTSSYGEGFPNTIGEAMACGKRCVVTDVGDTARVVDSTGVIKPVGDADELAAGWLEMLAQSADQRSQNEAQCRARIIEHYSVEAMVESYSRLFLEYCERSQY